MIAICSHDSTNKYLLFNNKSIEESSGKDFQISQDLERNKTEFQNVILIKALSMAEAKLKYKINGLFSDALN